VLESDNRRIFVNIEARVWVQRLLWRTEVFDGRPQVCWGRGSRSTFCCRTLSRDEDDERRMAYLGGKPPLTNSPLLMATPQDLHPRHSQSISAAATLLQGLWAVEYGVQVSFAMFEMSRVESRWSRVSVTSCAWLNAQLDCWRRESRTTRRRPMRIT
jgi:hypothetical protein